ncbi:MAG: universal stress protein [Nitrospirae bacterium]|nr:universal stress protein [Nitrospirota bacterium]
MSAISFAEEGEFNTAREMLREERRVLLAVKEGQIAGKTLKYALNTCKRIGASLDILYVSLEGRADEKIDPLLQRFYSDLEKEGIRYSVIQKNGCIKQEIIDYTNSKKGVLFAVTESSNHLDVDCKGRNKKLSEAWQNLKCPLVVVADNV